MDGVDCSSFFLLVLVVILVVIAIATIILYFRRRMRHADKRNRAALELTGKSPKANPENAWKMAKDKTTGRHFYFNKVTRKTTWTDPDRLVVHGSKKTVDEMI